MDIRGKLGLSQWGYANRKDRILLAKTISVSEQLSVIFAMMAREPDSLLADHAQYLLVSDSLLFLKHLILHEVAHIKNKCQQRREVDCDLWAFERI